MRRITILFFASAMSLIGGQAVANHGEPHGGGNLSRASVGVENECTLDIANDEVKFIVKSTITNKRDDSTVLVTLKETTAQYKPDKKGGGNGVAGNELVNIDTQGCEFALNMYTVECAADGGSPPLLIGPSAEATHTVTFDLCPADPDLDGARALNAAVNLMYTGCSEADCSSPPSGFNQQQPRTAQESQCRTSVATDGSQTLEFSGGLPMKAVLDAFLLGGLAELCQQP